MPTRPDGCVGGGGDGDDPALRFEPIDFDDLHELIKLAQEANDSGARDPVAAALELGVSETEKVAAEIDSKLEVLEEESIGDYAASFQSFEDLHREIRDTDKVLEKMEKMLGAYQSDLSGISHEIKFTRRLFGYECEVAEQEGLAVAHV